MYLAVGYIVTYVHISKISDKVYVSGVTPVRAEVTMLLYKEFSKRTVCV
jgi:hypothetical protein